MTTREDAERLLEKLSGAVLYIQRPGFDPALTSYAERDLIHAALRALPPPEPTEGAKEVARRMQQTFDVSGDKWFKVAADLILSQDAALRAMPLQDHGWQDETRRLIDEQAKDEGLWFQAQTCAEAYVQTALRKLHAAVEGDKSVIFPARAMVAEQQTRAK